MKDIVLIHRNVRMFDNPALFHGSKNQDQILNLKKLPRMFT